jgi:hypothetical protein
VRHLPPESATATERRVAQPEGEGGGSQVEADEVPWSQSELLLAAMYDALRRIEWLYVSAHAKNPPKPPDPLPRPGVKRVNRKRMTVGEYRRLTGQDPPARLISGERATEGS